MLAKEMMDVVGLIVFEFSFTRQQPERVWLHDRAPHPRFGANRAVAFESAPAQINVRLESFSDFGRETLGLGNAKRLHFQL